MLSKPFTVGLTGGIGSGKSAAAAFFAELGVPIVDVDVISHALTSIGSPILAEIIQAFGQEYLMEDGALSRKKLGRTIFSDAAAKAKLEAILHPAIFSQAQQQLIDNKTQYAEKPYQILAVPLLFESPRYVALCDKTLLIDCPEDMQIARTMARSDLTALEVQNILNTQMPRQQRLNLADNCLENNGNLADLREKVLALHQNYLSTCN